MNFSRLGKPFWCINPLLLHPYDHFIIIIFFFLHFVWLFPAACLNSLHLLSHSLFHLLVDHWVAMFRIKKLGVFCMHRKDCPLLSISKRWFLLLFSQNWTIVTPCLQVHPRILLVNSRGCRILLPGLLFNAVGNITSLLFCSLHWLPVSCRIQGLISVSLLPFWLLHKYTPSRQFRSSSDSFTFHVPTTNIKTLGERSFSSNGPTV